MYIGIQFDNTQSPEQCQLYKSIVYLAQNFSEKMERSVIMVDFFFLSINVSLFKCMTKI